MMGTVCDFLLLRMWWNLLKRKRTIRSKRCPDYDGFPLGGLSSKMPGRALPERLERMDR